MSIEFLILTMDSADRCFETYADYLEVRRNAVEQTGNDGQDRIIYKAYKRVKKIASPPPVVVEDIIC